MATPDAVSAPASEGLSTFAPGAPVSDPAATEKTAQAAPLPIWAWAGGLGALVLIALTAFMWRRRTGNRARRLPPPIITDRATSDDGDAPITEMPRLDMVLEVISASRSLMMFTIEYRLNFSNRTDRAVRDLTISAQLACAERGSGNAPPIAGGQKVGTIERIGPHQTRAIAGQIQLPLSDVRAILQGQKPIFIPLLHLTMDSAGHTPFTRSFVLGTQSAASQGRLHPIPLDTPPGGVPGLLAREISLAA